MHLVRALVSFAALVGGLALLLADDAGPQCELVAFERTFTITSSCAPLAETVRFSSPGDELGTATPAAFEHISGDSLVMDASVSGTCKEDKAPIDYRTLQLSLPLTQSAGGSAQEPGLYYCSIKLDTLEVYCSEQSTGEMACTLTVTES
jgi:hypothetical protein